MSNFIRISHGCNSIEVRCDIMGPAGPPSMEMQARRRPHEVRGKTAAAPVNYKDAACISISFVALTLAHRAGESDDVRAQDGLA